MPRLANRLVVTRAAVVAAVALALLPAPAKAQGRVGWLDEVVQQAVRDARAEARVGARAATRAAEEATPAGRRLFAREADAGLEALARRSDDLARAAGRPVDAAAGPAAEAALEVRFARLVKADPDAARTFRSLAPAERRLVVELGETARRLARRHPDGAEPLIRSLGVDGLSAVRAYGDDVAEVVAKEGPEAVDVLRKTGRPGWKFYTSTVLAHKKKLAAAGVLALFLADPDKFVDSAGRATEFAVQQFARAGIQLAGSMGDGAARGMEGAIGEALASYGLNSLVVRKIGMVGAGLIALFATLVLLGLPVGWALRPVLWPIRLAKLAFGRRRAA